MTITEFSETSDCLTTISDLIEAGHHKLASLFSMLYNAYLTKLSTYQLPDASDELRTRSLALVKQTSIEFMIALNDSPVDFDSICMPGPLRTMVKFVTM